MFKTLYIAGSTNPSSQVQTSRHWLIVSHYKRCGIYFSSLVAALTSFKSKTNRSLLVVIVERELYHLFPSKAANFGQHGLTLLELEKKKLICFQNWNHSLF